MSVRPDSKAQRLIPLAEKEARRFNHEYIGTEHLLLALVKEDTGFTSGVLRNLNLDPNDAIAWVEKIIQPGLHAVPAGHLSHTPPCKRVVEGAIQEMLALKHPSLCAPHVLLGMTREKDCVAAQVLMNLGVTLEVIRSEVLRQLEATPPE